MKQINFKVDDEVKKALDHYCIDNNTDITKVLRDAISGLIRGRN